jgi:hypothetical protein
MTFLSDAPLDQLDRKGTLLIDRKFDDARPFSEGLAAVKVEKKYGFIDKAGNWIIKSQFEGGWGSDFPHRIFCTIGVD